MIKDLRVWEENAQKGVKKQKNKQKHTIEKVNALSNESLNMSKNITMAYSSAHFSNLGWISNVEYIPRVILSLFSCSKKQIPMSELLYSDRNWRRWNHFRFCFTFITLRLLSTFKFIASQSFLKNGGIQICIEPLAWSSKRKIYQINDEGLTPTLLWDGKSHRFSTCLLLFFFLKSSHAERTVLTAGSLHIANDCQRKLSSSEEGGSLNNSHQSPETFQYLITELCTAAENKSSTDGGKVDDVIIALTRSTFEMKCTPYKLTD